MLSFLLFNFEKISKKPFSFSLFPKSYECLIFPRKSLARAPKERKGRLIDHRVAQIAQIDSWPRVLMEQK